MSLGELQPREMHRELLHVWACKAVCEFLTFSKRMAQLAEQSFPLGNWLFSNPAQRLSRTVSPRAFPPCTSCQGILGHMGLNHGPSSLPRPKVVQVLTGVLCFIHLHKDTSLPSPSEFHYQCSILVAKALLPPPSPPAGGAMHWAFSVIYSAGRRSSMPVG